MDLQQALDLMRQVKAGPRFSQWREGYYAHVSTEDGESFQVEVHYNSDWESSLDSVEAARQERFL